MKKHKQRADLAQTFILILLALIVVLPIYIAIANTFKNSDIILDSPLSLPIPPTLQNIVDVLKSPIPICRKCTEIQQFSWWLVRF